MGVPGFYTAAQLIDEALAGLRDFDRTYYKEATMYFMRGFRDFKLFSEYGDVQETYQPVTSINTVNYPEDAMRIITLGVVVNRELFTFTRADDLVAPISSPIDNFLDEERGEDGELRRSPTYGYVATAANQEYYFRDDKVKRRLILGRRAVDKTRFADRSEVLVRYISNGVTNFDTTYIPNEAANLLINYIEYKIVDSMPDKYDARYRAERKENYFEARNMYESLQLPTLDELMDMIYETSSQSVRRLS